MAGQFYSTVQSIGPDAALFAQVFGAQSFNPIQLPIAQGGSSDSIRDRGTNCGSSSCFGVQMAVQPFCEPEWGKSGAVNNHEGVPLAKTEPTAVPSQDLK